MPVETQAPGSHATEIEKAFLENHELVFRTAFRITGNASDAEDVLQTLFLRLVRREWVLDTQAGWTAYLHRAAVNISLDILRKRGRQVSLGDLELVIGESGPDAERALSALDLRKWLEIALAELAPTAAQMFILRHVEGYGNREIAKMLNTSQGVVAVTLFRTRSRLRKSIRKILGGS